MKARMSETELQMHLVALLNAYARPDIEWHHVPNGEERHPATAKRLRQLGVQPGVGDLMFLIDGHVHAVELKTEIGTQSGKQSEWQERFERAGGAYHIAFGLDEALAVLKSIGAFRANVSFTTKADGGGVRRRPWHSPAKAANQFKDPSSETAAGPIGQRCRPGFSAQT